MARIVYDLIDPAVLIDYSRQYDLEVARPDSQFVLDRYLPDRTIDDLEYRLRKGSLNDQDTAEYRAFDTPAPMSGRSGVQTMRGSLGPVSRQIPLGEEEYLRQRALMQGTQDEIIAAVYADAERMVRAVQARIELARGDVINDGKVTIQENGLALEANFGRRPAFSKVAGTVWTDISAPILQNLLDWVEEYTDVNGVEPGEILMSRTRLANFARNTEMRSYAAANGTIPSRLNQATVSEILAAEGLPPIALYDTKVRVNGVRTNVLPANKVFLMPPAGEGYGQTFFGVTAEALKLADKGVIERTVAPGIVTIVTETEHPVQTFTVGTAIALPATPNADLVMDIQVAA